MVIQSESNLKATVELYGGVARHYREELRQRYIRADERTRIGKRLETKLPRALYLETLKKLSSEAINSENHDECPRPSVLKAVSWSLRRQARCHPDEVVSLCKLVENKSNSKTDVLQKLILHPRGVMLWSKRSLEIFHSQCEEDIVYLDATGSIMKRGKLTKAPFYVYELVVRNPKKGSPPFPVGTFLTCEHTTSSVQYFLASFRTHHRQLYGKALHPTMIVCDGSVVLLQALAQTIFSCNLNNIMYMYYRIITGKATMKDCSITILHRCLSHLMKNAKSLCKKQ